MWRRWRWFFGFCFLGLVAWLLSKALLLQLAVSICDPWEIFRLALVSLGFGSILVLGSIWQRQWGIAIAWTGTILLISVAFYILKPPFYNTALIREAKTGSIYGTYWFQVYKSPNAPIRFPYRVIDEEEIRTAQQ